ncbi:hypothetical protein MMPV_001138 [Pyropia vietnamensis]
MMRQYVETKRSLPAYLLLMRVGDFFEAFFEDAPALAAAAGIVLTAKDGGVRLRRKVPMAGVPASSLEDKARAVVSAGIPVAVADQVEPSAVAAAAGGGLVRRAVTRLITPGTRTADDAGGDAPGGAGGVNNYLAALAVGEQEESGLPGQAEQGQADGQSPRSQGPPWGLAAADVSTGDFIVAGGWGAEELLGELARLDPAELLVADRPRAIADGAPTAGVPGRVAATVAAADAATPATANAVDSLLATVRAAGYTPPPPAGTPPSAAPAGSGRALLTPRPPAEFDPVVGGAALCSRYGVASVAAFGCGGTPLAVGAAGALLAFVADTLERDVLGPGGAGAPPPAPAPATPPARSDGATAGTPSEAAAGAATAAVAAPAAAADAVHTLWDAASTFESRRVPLNPPRLLPRAAYLHLGARVIRDIEVLATARDGGRAGSLAAAVDGTATPGGRRLLRSWLLAPLRDTAAIGGRGAAVGALVAAREAAAGLAAALAGLPDLARLGGRVGGRRASPRELQALARGCARLPAVRAAVMGVVSAAAAAGVTDAGVLPELAASLGDERLDSAAEAVLGALVDPAPACLATFADYSVSVDGAPPDEGGGNGAATSGDGRPGRTAILRTGYNSDLDALRATAAGGAAALRAYEAESRAAVGVPGVKVRQIKNAGFALRVPRAAGERLLADDAAHFSRHGWSLRGSTRAELRYVSPELAAIERDAAAAAAAVAGFEVRLYRALRDSVGDLTPAVRAAAAAVAALDVLTGWASLAARRGYCRPVFLDAADADGGDGVLPTVELRALRHPVVERCLPSGVEYVPNDVALGGSTGTHLAMLTAANGAGKSVYLYALAAAVVLAQAGCWVPAASARLTVTSALYTRVGAVDDVSGGLSTFGVEMAETATICASAGEGALVLADEVGRGTAVADGLAVAYAVAEYLAGGGAGGGGAPPLTVFATHFHELNALAELRPNVTALRIETLAEEVWEGGEGDPADASDVATTTATATATSADGGAAPVVTTPTAAPPPYPRTGRSRWVPSESAPTPPWTRTGATRPTHRVAAGAAWASHGVETAARAGLPPAVVARARDLVGALAAPARGLAAHLRAAVEEGEGDVLPPRTVADPATDSATDCAAAKAAAASTAVADRSVDAAVAAAVTDAALREAYAAGYAAARADVLGALAAASAPPPSPPTAGKEA